ncbi:MAG: hypothetical protein D6791_04710 [Chloroflexi bacterium]|nr:MAG: hypothetical protein D6791_04710 [Chloroflexota bacterium]
MVSYAAIAEKDLMPLLTRVYIRTAFLYLLVGMVLSVLLSLLSSRLVSGLAVPLTPTYLHIMIVGWITQLIFGVVYWMFPRYSQDRPRGYDQLAWASYILLNLGLILRIIAEPLITPQTDVAELGPLLVVSAALQWLAGVAFVLNTWPRVKER